MYVRRYAIFFFYRLQINSFSLNSPLFSNYTPSCSFEVKWKVDTGKCVDASPLVVQHSNGSTERQQTALVYIGSHSGWFFAIDVSSGTVLWKTLLNDRIESSACTSLCGQYVIVGKCVIPHIQLMLIAILPCRQFMNQCACVHVNIIMRMCPICLGTYSGSLYTLVVSSGAIHWCLVLPGPCEPIKSSPVADPNTGLIWFGSHEQHLYGVDILVSYFLTIFCKQFFATVYTLLCVCAYCRCSSIIYILHGLGGISIVLNYRCTERAALV